jgi:hypothetical protein
MDLRRAGKHQTLCFNSRVVGVISSAHAAGTKRSDDFIRPEL